MLDIHCADCGRVLIGSRQVISMTSTDDGIHVAYVCWCGRPGAETTGRRRRRHVPTNPVTGPRTRAVTV